MPTRATSERSLKPGDHAYVAPPFDHRGGSPYLIVRILDLPQTPPGGIPKAKVAYYLRRRDVTNRSLADHRVIFATFMDGVVPLSHIRQKVQVMYRDYLEDPEAFKRQPDSFVFSQIYDRFMHKPFDLIPTSQVMNAPDNILEYLKANYEFVCTELGSGPGLCDAMRGCIACHGFAAKDDSVTCTICSKTWHLGCLDPPLLKKPALGWRWSCIKCTMEEEDDSSDADSAITPNSDRQASRAARRKAKPLLTQKNGKLDKGKAPAIRPQLDVAKWKSLNGWPYRYFGEHVHHDSVLDPHDPIWPRASTSVGSRYQCTDIPGEEPDPTIRRGPVPKKKRVRKKDKAEVVEPERGADDACEILWRPDASTSEVALEDLLAPVKSEMTAGQKGNVDLIIDALRILSASDSVPLARAKLEQLRSTRPYHASLVKWSADDSHLFDLDLEEHEDELGRFDRARTVKTMPEVVHHYYREKGYLKRFMHLEDPAQDKFAAAGPQGIEAELGELAVDEDEDGNTSVFEDGSNGSSRKSRYNCAVCGTDKANTWYSCPDGLGIQEIGKTHVLCPSCSTEWRHYGNPNPAITEAELNARASKDGKPRGRPPNTARRSPSPAEKKPTSDKPYGRHVQHSDGSWITLPVKSCVLCKRPEPRATNFECRVCGLSCHAGCYGIKDDTDPENWICDGCTGPQQPPTVPATCQLCPKSEDASTTKQSHTALDAYKLVLTGGAHVHLICALWNHEVAFNDLDNLEGALGFEAATRRTRANHLSCTLCKKEDGACVKCDSCPNLFHVSCAWQAGYRFSFDILPFTPKWRDILGFEATFKEETGDMRAVITCKAHPWTYDRLLYDLGQKDRNTNLTALMTFAKYGKSESLSNWVHSFRDREVGAVPVLPADTASGSVPTIENPLSLAEVYAEKAPYTKPTKPKKKKKESSKSLTTALPVQTAPISAVDQHPTSTAVTSQDGPAVNSIPIHAKKRKRQESDTSRDANLSMSSEDEVMPTATTSRARGAARQSRGVSLKDILIDDNPPNRPPTKSETVHKPNGRGKVRQETAFEGSWGYSTLKDGTVVWNPIEEDVLARILLHRDGSSGSLQPEEMVRRAVQRKATLVTGRDVESEPSTPNPFPAWQVLQLPSLALAYQRNLADQQRILTTPSSTRLWSAGHRSPSSVTVPREASPRLELGKQLNDLASGHDSITPIPMAKQESSSGSMPPEAVRNAAEASHRLGGPYIPW